MPNTCPPGVGGPTNFVMVENGLQMYEMGKVPAGLMVTKSRAPEQGSTKIILPPKLIPAAEAKSGRETRAMSSAVNKNMRIYAV